MKANELMIGDLVMFPIGIAKVRELSYVKGKGFYAWFAASATLFPAKVEGLEHIEITTEFLEKNFVRNSENAVENVFGIFDDFYDLFIYPLQDGMWTMEYSSCEFNIPEERIYVSWVHELQHFLTHCGIEKELII